MKLRTCFISAVTLAVLAATSVATQESDGSQPTPSAETEVATPAVTKAAAAMAVSIDPVTGRLRPADPSELEGLLTEKMLTALDTSSAGLSEVESPTPGGGVMVNLQGRFSSVQWATVDARGHLEGHCETGGSPSTSRDEER